MKVIKLEAGLSAIAFTLLSLTGAEGVYANVSKTLAPSGLGGAQTSTFVQVPTHRSGGSSQGEQGPPITTTSGRSEIALARHLKSINAKMYAAYWCPYCHAQEQLFGKEAFAEIERIECDPRGKNAQTDLCKAANIVGFPTWEINSKFYSGLQSLDKLAELSGYQGSRDFQQSFPPQTEK